MANSERTYGVDVSHWNNELQIETHIKNKKNNIQFLIAKATEGTSFTDNEFDSWMKMCEKYGIIKGAYHYARPDISSPKGEAEHFVNTVKKYVADPPMLLALDWEGSALQYKTWTTEWAREWLDYVYNATGIKPLIYISESATAPFISYASGKNLFELDYGLWVAKWRGEPDKARIRPWSFWAIHQYTNEPFDKDVFHSSVENLIKYGTPKKQHATECKCKCGKCKCEAGQENI